MTERIEKINMELFLMEPALFKVLCSHQIVVNTSMQCPIRAGNRRIEYNPVLCKEISDNALRELFKVECIRILLKHPYTRQPSGCSAEAITIGSNCVVSDNYKIKHISLDAPKDLGLEKNMYFEYYVRAIQERMPSQGGNLDGGNDEGQQSQQQLKSLNNKGLQGDSIGDSQQNSDGNTPQNQQVNSGGNIQQNEPNNVKTSSSEGPGSCLSDTSALWKDDRMAIAEINELIKVIEASDRWGSLTSNFAGKIIASTKLRIDYRKVMQSFRADILSSKRRLTRMRPNRRSGFENYGSVYRLTSRLLVAIDVSGSTTDKMVSNFFGIINKFFKYGIAEIGVIQFDAEIKGAPENLKKAKKGNIDILGRGGTNFQPVIDYAHSMRSYYHGLIILTDGYASMPNLPDYFGTPILWVLPDEKLYEQHKNWMLKSGKACFINEY